MRRIILGAGVIASLFAPTSQGPYITTCHNDQECGTICGTTGPDTASPTQGLFGVSCQCQNGQPPVHKCTKDGIDVKVCSDNKPPRCSSSYCNKQICIKMGSKKSTATVRSACPKYHPQNADQCCQYGGSYCTCIKQQTIDVNWKPYAELGGQNGFADSVTIGACGNGDTGIEADSEEGREWFKKHAEQNEQIQIKAEDIVGAVETLRESYMEFVKLLRQEQ